VKVSDAAGRTEGGSEQDHDACIGRRLFGSEGRKCHDRCKAIRRCLHHLTLSVMRRMPPPLPTFLAVYGLLYAAFGVQSPFLPALLSEQGLHAEEIGIVLAASTAIRVLAGPAVGNVADRLRRHTLTLCACSFVAAITGLGYVTIRGYSGLLLVALVQAAMLAPIVPISDALATTAARRSESGAGRRFEYGWLRAAGSAAFIAGTMLSGWTASGDGLASIVWFSGALLGLGGAAGLLLPAIPSPRVPSGSFPRSTTRDWTSLLQIPAFRLLLIIAALVEGSHALHDSFSVIRWRAAGAGLPIISALWSESVLSEVLVFLLIGPRLVRLLAPGGAMAVAAVAGIIRWTVAASTTSPVILAFVQPLHGFTFALLHLAAMQVIVRVVPLRLAATAQAIYGTLCIGLATALLTLVSGILYERMGGPAFLVMAALCLLALPLCVRLHLSSASLPRC
jgi:MFS transporter, PPP family, 3-phenylpropionic acid transporter